MYGKSSPFSFLPRNLYPFFYSCIIVPFPPLSARDCLSAIETLYTYQLSESATKPCAIECAMDHLRNLLVLPNRIREDHPGLSDQEDFLKPSHFSDVNRSSVSQLSSSFYPILRQNGREESINSTALQQYVKLTGNYQDDQTGTDPRTTKDGRPTVYDRLVHRIERIGACLCVCSAMLELVLLVFLFDIYVSFPRDSQTGRLPRISPVYSIWPFISCVGSERLAVYITFSLLISFLLTIANLVGFYSGRNTRPGYFLRRLRLLISLISSCLFIWLVFASSSTSDHLHLFIVSLRISFLFSNKVISWLIDHRMRIAYPPLRLDYIARFSKWWRNVLLVLAFPTAVLADTAIYACKDHTLIQTPGTICYNLMAISAISDWAYSLINILFIFNFAFELYYDEHLVLARGTGALPNQPMRSDAVEQGCYQNVHSAEPKQELLERGSSELSMGATMRYSAYRPLDTEAETASVRGFV